MIYYHILENRYVLRHISNMKNQSWVDLGSWGCREKKIKNCHKYATFEGSLKKNVVASSLKLTFYKAEKNIQINV